MTSKKSVVLDLFFLKALELDDFELFRKSLMILSLIYDKCHKILPSKSLNELYSKYLRSFEKSFKSYYDRTKKNYFIFLMNKILLNSDKISEVKELNIRINASEDDIPIIRTACTRFYSIIVTSDEDDFKRNEEVMKVLEEYKVKVLNLDEAIKELSL